jgi:nitronate monooxygenase
MGTRFLATKEARAVEGYKEMIVNSNAADIVYTTAFTGEAANFMAGSVTASGYDIDKVRKEGTTAERVRPAPGEKSKAWVGIWAAGQGAGNIHDIPTVHELTDRLKREYEEATQEMAERLGFKFSAAAQPAPANDVYRSPSPLAIKPKV